MAEDPTKPAEGADPEKAKEAEAEKRSADIEHDRTATFWQRTRDQLVKGAQAATGEVSRAFGGAPGQAAANVSEILLRGSRGDSRATLPIRYREQTQKVPAISPIPTLRLPFTRIQTGLDPEVDRVLNKSQQELIAAISETYNVLQTRMVEVQRAVTVMDRNVRIIERGAKLFQESASQKFEDIESAITRLKRSQDQPQFAVKPFESLKQEDATKVKEGFSLADLLSPKNLALLWGGIGGAAGLSGLVLPAAAAAAGVAIFGENWKEIKTKGWWQFLADNPMSPGDSWFGPEGFLHLKKFFGGANGMQPLDQSKMLEDLKAGREANKQLGEIKEFLKKRLMRPGTQWAPGGPQPSGIGEDLNSLLISPAGAAERPEERPRGFDWLSAGQDKGPAIPETGTGRKAELESFELERAEINITASQRMVFEARQRITIKAPYITFDSPLVEFTGAVKGLGGGGAAAGGGAPYTPIDEGREAARREGAGAYPGAGAGYTAGGAAMPGGGFAGGGGGFAGGAGATGSWGPPAAGPGRGRAGGGAPQVSGAPTGGVLAGASAADREAYYREVAKKAGIDPDQFVGTARAEGLNYKGSWGGGADVGLGGSYGDFQLNRLHPTSMGNRFIRDTGLPLTPETWKQQAEYAANVIRKKGYGEWTSQRGRTQAIRTGPGEDIRISSQAQAQAQAKAVTPAPAPSAQPAPTAAQAVAPPAVTAAPVTAATPSSPLPPMGRTLSDIGPGGSIPAQQGLDTARAEPAPSSIPAQQGIDTAKAEQGVSRTTMPVTEAPAAGRAGPTIEKAAVSPAGTPKAATEAGGGPISKDERVKVVGNAAARGLGDPRITNIVTEASKYLPEGYKAEIYSGKRPGDPRFHGKGMALDLRIIDPQGHTVSNYQDPKNFRLYEQFAQASKKIQSEQYPELDKAFRWGGYFSGGKGVYGAMDLMHFDIGGEKVGMAGGSFEGGLTAQQRKIWGGAPVSEGMGDVAQFQIPGAKTEVAQAATAAPTPGTEQPGPTFARASLGGAPSAATPSPMQPAGPDVAKGLRTAPAQAVSDMTARPGLGVTATESASDKQQAMVAFANKYGMHPDALAGVLHTESGLDPSILKGGAGGKFAGIFQLQHSQIPGLTEKAGLGRLSPEQYSQLGFSDQLKVMDTYYQSNGIQPGFFTGDAKTDSAKAWALQLNPGRAKGIDYSDPNAVISATKQAGSISEGGQVTVGSAMRQTPVIGASLMGGSYKEAGEVDLRRPGGAEKPIDWTKVAAKPGGAPSLAAQPQPVVPKEPTTGERVRSMLGISPAGAAERPQTAAQSRLAESQKMATEVKSDLAKKTEAMKTPMPAMPGGEIKPATQVKISPAAAPAMAAHGVSPHAAAVKPEQHISPVTIEPALRTGDQEMVIKDKKTELRDKKPLPKPKPAEKQAPGPRIKKEPQSHPQSNPQHLTKQTQGNAKQPNRSASNSPAANRPSSGGDRGSGGGGGGAQPEHCHFCDLD